MRKLLLSAALLAASPASAQYTIPGGGSGGAPTDAQYIVATANGTLSAERVCTDTATIDCDAGTAGQMKFNLITPIRVATECATPNFSFTDDTGAGLCLSAADTVHFQSSPAGSNPRSIVTATATGTNMVFVDAGGASTEMDIIDDEVAFAIGGGQFFVLSPALATFGRSAAHDQIRIAPVALGGGSFVGSITSSDLTAARTWTVPDATGTFCLSTDCTVSNGATTAGRILFKEDSDNGSNSVTLIGPASTADVTVTLPAAAGTLLLSPGAGFPADTDGAGTLAARTITAGTGISVANGAGAAGNPTVSLDTATTPQYSSGAGSASATGAVGTWYHETDAGLVSTYSATDTLATMVTTQQDSIANADWFIDEDSFATNSATRVPSQQSVKAYVDASGGAFDGNVTGQFSFQADISPSQITSNQNDYSGCTAASNAVCRLSTDAARNITGIAAGADGRVLRLVNVGAQLISLTYDDAASSAGNKFVWDGAANEAITFGGGGSVDLIYDSTSSAWRVVGGRTLSLSTGMCVGRGGAYSNCEGDIAVYDALGDAAIGAESAVAGSYAIITTKNNNGAVGYLATFGSGAGGEFSGIPLANATILNTDNSVSALLLNTNNAPVAIGVANVQREFIEDGSKTLVNTTATTTFQITGLGAHVRSGGTVNFCVEAADASNDQVACGDAHFGAVDTTAGAGGETCFSAVVGTVSAVASGAASSGTLTVTSDATAGTDLCNIRFTASSSLTPTTLRVTYHVFLNTRAGVVTPQ